MWFWGQALLLTNWLSDLRQVYLFLSFFSFEILKIEDISQRKGMRNGTMHVECEAQCPT